MVSADTDPPVDRPNLSKDYLAGEAQDDWIPLWPPELYTERRVDLVLGTSAVQIEPSTRTVLLTDGSRREYGALLIATGAEPDRLQVPGVDTADVRYLRTFADARAIVERVGSAKQIVVVGASFIGLEVAASLRARGLAVTWSRRTSVRCRASWARSSERSSRPCTNHTASCFTSERRWPRSRAAA